MENVKASINLKDFASSRQFWAYRDQKMLDIFEQMQEDGIKLENNYEYDGNVNPQKVRYVSYREPHYYAKVILGHAGEYRFTLTISLDNHMNNSVFSFAVGCEQRVKNGFGTAYKYQSNIRNFFTEDAKNIGCPNPYLNFIFLADIEEMYNLVKWSMERVKAVKFDGFESDFGQQFALFTTE